MTGRPGGRPFPNKLRCLARCSILLFAAALFSVLAAAFAAAADKPDRPDWETYYEKSGKVATPRYDETVAFCRRLDAAADWIRYATFGKSAQGRDLPLVIASRTGVFTPGEARRARARGDVVVLIQAGIHAGEIEGKDAGLLLLRDMAVNGAFPDLLEHVTVLFIPIFNVDGHERFGPYNRINQNGPEEMGWRTTAAGLNLNRDYLKADAEETRAWLRLFDEWSPDFLMDLHTTDGADYQYVVTYIVDVFGNLVPPLNAWARDTYLTGIKTSMAEAGFPLSPYVFLREWPNPKSGMISWVSSPRFSQGYASIRNRPGILVETHMLKPYVLRVEGTYQIIRRTIELLGRERKGLRGAIATADSLVASPEFRREPFPLRFWYDPSDSVMIDFQGVRFEEVESDLTGGAWVRFSGEPESFSVPYFTRQKVLASARLPEAYVIPPEWRQVIERLAVHGVEFRRLEKPAVLEVASYRFSNPRWQQAPYEGRHPVRFDVEEIVETRTFPAGSAVVDMNQPNAQVAAHILEPAGPDSYVQWGFFDAIFEQKEYADSYVMEKVARDMLANDADLRREFEEAKAANPEFAKDASQILRWFYQRTPYWDDRKDKYPVGKIAERAALRGLNLVSGWRESIPLAPLDDRIRIAEGRRIVERLGDGLWPGFRDAPSAVLLVTPEREYLFRHPNPTSDFTPVGYDSVTESEVYARDRVHPDNLLATFPAVSGVPTVVIGQPRRTSASHTTRWVATLLHEHFHQYQDSQADYYEAVAALDLAGSDTTGMWMLDYPFPYEAKDVNEAFSAMCRALREALEAVGKGSFRGKVSTYLDARRAFRGRLDAKDYAYFSFQLWQEGIARYTEYTLTRRAAVAYTPTAAFAALSDRVPFAKDADETYAHIMAELARASLASAKRTAFYHVGAAEGLLLDQVDPGWRARYLSEKFFSEDYFESTVRAR